MILSGYLAKHLVTADLPLTFSTRTTPVGAAGIAGSPSATASSSIVSPMRATSQLGHIPGRTKEKRINAWAVLESVGTACFE
jgi:hypothetical protein